MGAGLGKKKKKAQGFTLVELLVVIAIIAILSAILVPAVRKAIGSAQRVRAMHSVRQVVMAYIQYANGSGSVDQEYWW